MNAELHDILKQWLLKAANDLKNAHIVIQNNDPPTDTIIYHCQQAIEKYLEAYLYPDTFYMPTEEEARTILQITEKAIQYVSDYSIANA